MLGKPGIWAKPEKNRSERGTEYEAGNVSGLRISRKSQIQRQSCRRVKRGESERLPAIYDTGNCEHNRASRKGKYGLGCTGADIPWCRYQNRTDERCQSASYKPKKDKPQRADCLFQQASKQEEKQSVEQHVWNFGVNQLGGC